MKRYTARINIILRNELLWKKLEKMDLSRYKMGGKYGKDIFKDVTDSFVLEKKWFASAKALKSLVVELRKRLGTDALIIGDVKDTDPATGFERNYAVFSLYDRAEDLSLGTEEHRRTSIKDVEAWFENTGIELRTRDLYIMALFPGKQLDKLRIKIGRKIPEGSFEYSQDKRGNLVIEKYKGSSKEVFIPAYDAKGRAVVAIADGVFEAKPITAVVIPYGIEKIGKNAFADCKYLNHLFIADSVSEIGKGAFAECSSVQQIRIPGMLKKLPDEVFYNCEGITRLVIPGNIKVIGNAAFAYCDALQKVKINKGVRILGNSAFLGCDSLEECVLPKGLFVIGGQAFADCTSLEKLQAPSNYGWIGEEAFSNCSELFSIYAKRGSKAFEYARAREIDIIEL